MREEETAGRPHPARIHIQNLPSHRSLTRHSRNNELSEAVRSEGNCFSRTLHFPGVTSHSRLLIPAARLTVMLGSITSVKERSSVFKAICLEGVYISTILLH